MPRKKSQIAGVYEKTSGSGIWYIRYREGNKQVKKRVGNRDLALEALNKIRLIQATGEGIVAKSAKGRTLTHAEIDGSAYGGVTVGVLCDEYLAHLEDPNNSSRPGDLVNPPKRLAKIKEAFGDRSAASIMPYEIVEWLDSLGRKPGTMNRYRSTFSGVYRYAIFKRKLDRNPVRETSQARVLEPDPRFLEEDEEPRIRAVLNRWIAECPEHYRLRKLYLRCHPIELTVAIGTGMRKGNQYGIRWEEHVNMTRREIKLTPEMTKTRKAQTIYMNDDVYAALKELQAIQAEILELQTETSSDQNRKRMVADGRVFVIQENREWWSAALREAGIKNFRWHDLRHTTGTRLVDNEVHLKVIQRALGHKNIKTTVRYAHARDKALQEAMASLNRLRPESTTTGGAACQSPVSTLNRRDDDGSAQDDAD